MTAVGETPPAPAPVGRTAYRWAMRSQVCGVAVITTTTDRPVGFCATSLASVSLDPPILSFAVRREADSGRAWMAAGGGLVHLLHDGQAGLAQAFATSGADRFGGRFRWTWSAEGYPELADRLALLAVEAVARQVVGDHVVILGAVTRVARSAGPARPLAHYDGGFHRVGELPEPGPVLSPPPGPGPLPRLAALSPGARWADTSEQVRHRHSRHRREP